MIYSISPRFLLIVLDGDRRLEILKKQCYESPPERLFAARTTHIVHSLDYDKNNEV